MATIDQENAVRERLKTSLNALLDVDLKKLAREAELGTQLGFAEAIPYFERIIKLYKKLEHANLDGVSHGALNGVYNGANDALNLFKSIQDFNPQQGPNPSESRKRLIDNARDQYDAHYSRISPVLAFVAKKEAKMEEYEQKARIALDTVNKLAAEWLQKGKEFEGSANNTLAKLQEVAGKFGVAQHAVNFREQSEEHLSVAQRWFWATGVLVSISVIAVWLLFIGPLKPEIKDVQLGEIIFSITSRLVVFSIISFAIYWSAKNHGAHRHNYIINKHRQNALVTFQTFIEAAGEDPVVKNAVLLQAGQAVYTSQPTGYSENVSAPVNPANIVEVFKSMSTK